MQTIIIIRTPVPAFAPGHTIDLELVAGNPPFSRATNATFTVRVTRPTSS